MRLTQAEATRLRIPGVQKASGTRSRAGQSKYRAVRVEAYGRSWASKRELAEYERLLRAGGRGYLRDLELQPRFELIVEGHRIGRYTPDFRYSEVCDAGTRWIDVVEEVKGFRTRDYLIRRALFKALYPQIQFREVR